ncbi:hypothetical protein ACFQRB_14500 [Halobaculum litoreum]|uniref:Uncharacterized protein n=1 Tax=Halobaculum litoreum TaxID=3031998 RepID=A0ABD5XZ12_9EURY
MQVAVIDSAGVIVRTNSAWRSYGDWEGIDESTDPCGGNYLRACRGGGDGDGGDRSRAVDGGVRAAGPRAAEADGEAVAEGSSPSSPATPTASSTSTRVTPRTSDGGSSCAPPASNTPGRRSRR